MNNEFFDSIKQTFLKFSDFQGRAGRREWGFFALFSVILQTVLGWILIGKLAWLMSLIGLIIAVPMLAVTFRRYHDRNMSGWWSLLNLIPFFGTLIVLYQCLQPGDPMPNNFGYNPEPGGQNAITQGQVVNTYDANKPMDSYRADDQFQPMPQSYQQAPQNDPFDLGLRNQPQGWEQGPQQPDDPFDLGLRNRPSDQQ